jgi:PAS domain S-box-containing protein
MDEKQPLGSRYRAALAAGRIGVWSWDAATGLLDWDDVARELLGVAPDVQLSLQEFEDLVASDDRATRSAAWTKALDPAGMGELQVEWRVIPPNGDVYRWIAARGRVEFSDGAALRVVGVLQNITERRRAEARLAGILSIAADAIIAINEQRRIILFNDGAEQIFGYSRSEVLGQTLDVLLPDRFRKTHADHVQRFATSTVSARRMGERSEIYGRRKTGEEFPAEASISHLDLAGQSTFTVVLRDISERKRAEQQLAQSNAELEMRVAERTQELNAEMQRREITQVQLVRTQRMEAFGQLTGGVAHDFNNLLTVITGNLELLEMRLKDERERTLLKRAADAAEMGARLTARLLTFARRRQFETVQLNLNDCVVAMVDLLGRTLGEPITLQTQFEPQLWPTRADPSEIENAVLNLAINARDAMPNGGRLIIETTNVTVDVGQIGALSKLPAGDLPAGDYVRLSVSDTGSGMSAHVLQHAIEPFFTTKQPGKGTGLGLSTVYGFTQELGGTLTIYSELGHGTTVSVYLPRSVSQHAAPTRDRASEVVPLSAGEVVLLVEDNAEVRRVTASRLFELGYRVIDVDSGPAALEVLKSDQAVDVVFSDIVMAGGMSGFDVAEWVQTHRSELRLLLTSGYADEALRVQERPAAGLKILRKPYNRSELARAIRSTIDGNSG